MPHLCSFQRRQCSLHPIRCFRAIPTRMRKMWVRYTIPNHLEDDHPSMYTYCWWSSSVVHLIVTRRDIAATTITRRPVVPYHVEKEGHVRIALRDARLSGGLTSVVCFVTHCMGKTTVPPKLMLDCVLSLIEYQMLHDYFYRDRTHSSHSRYIDNVPKKCCHWGLAWHTKGLTEVTYQSMDKRWLTGAWVTSKQLYHQWQVFPPAIVNCSCAPQEGTCLMGFVCRLLSCLVQPLMSSPTFNVWMLVGSVLWESHAGNHSCHNCEMATAMSCLPNSLSTTGVNYTYSLATSSGEEEGPVPEISQLTMMANHWF